MSGTRTPTFRTWFAAPTLPRRWPRDRWSSPMAYPRPMAFFSLSRLRACGRPSSHPSRKPEPVGWDANPSINRPKLGLRFAPSQPTELCLQLKNQPLQPRPNPPPSLPPQRQESMEPQGVRQAPPEHAPTKNLRAEHSYFPSSSSSSSPSASGQHNHSSSRQPAWAETAPTRLREPSAMF